MPTPTAACWSRTRRSALGASASSQASSTGTLGPGCHWHPTACVRVARRAGCTQLPSTRCRAHALTPPHVAAPSLRASAHADQSLWHCSYGEAAPPPFFVYLALPFLSFLSPPARHPPVPQAHTFHTLHTPQASWHNLFRGPRTPGLSAQTVPGPHTPRASLHNATPHPAHRLNYWRVGAGGDTRQPSRPSQRPPAVGSKAAVFPMQLLGFDVDPVYSVQFSWLAPALSSRLASPPPCRAAVAWPVSLSCQPAAVRLVRHQPRTPPRAPRSATLATRASRAPCSTANTCAPCCRWAGVGNGFGGVGMGISGGVGWL
jgi:hypothetical protein